MPDRTISTLAAFVLVCALWIIMHSTRAEAANPTNGTISPTGPNVVWQGPVTGGAGANEDTCVEGTNCDTFKLTISGTEEDWAGKVVNININWLTPTNDYDLYAHKGASINNERTTNVPAPVEGVNLSPRPVPAADALQVTDFAQDIQVGLLAVLPLNDPLDILSVKYSCETTLD